MRRSGRWLVFGAPMVAACAQVIGADFNGLQPDQGAGGLSGSAGASQIAGASGSAAPAGGGGASAGGAGATGGGGEAAGAAGNVILDAAADSRGNGGTASTPDAAFDATGSDVVVGDHKDAATDAPLDGDVVINEIKGQGGGPDWIELYNLGQMPFALGGYTVAQAMGSTGPPDATGFLTFPQGTTLAGGAFLMVVAQQPSIGGPTTACQAIAASCFTVSWGISMGGERIYLLNPDPGKSIRQQVDYLASVMSGQTYARAENGTFQAAAPTPGQPNGI